MTELYTAAARYAHLTDDQLLGAEYMCRVLLTSPRMHKPQAEIIEEQIAEIRHILTERKRGVPTPPKVEEQQDG